MKKFFRNNTILRQLLLVIASVLLGSVFLWISGYEPLSIINGLKLAFTTDLDGTIRWAIPLILAGLAVSVTYRAQVFNLGVDGQLHIGACAAMFAALYVFPQEGGNPVLGIAGVSLAAMLAGALFALVPALLRIYLNTDEVVTTLLLNFVASLFVDFLILGPMHGTGSLAEANTTNYAPEYMWLPRLEKLFGKTTATVGIYIAIAICLILAFVMFRTRFGHEVKIVGRNRNLAQYSGINSKRIILYTMLLSGAIGGLVGAMEVLGPLRRMPQYFNDGLGFDGVVVALLANNNPIGCIFAGFFFGGLRNGVLNMERFSDVPAAVSDLVQAIVILAVSAQFTVPFIGKSIAHLKEKKAGKSAAQRREAVLRAEELPAEEETV